MTPLLTGETAKPKRLDSINFIVFSDKGTEVLLTDFAPYVLSGDIVTVVSGNNANPLDVDFVNTTAQTVKAQFPCVQIQAVTSGLAHLIKLAEKATFPIETIGHVYEPNQANNPDFCEDQRGTWGFFRQATAIAHRGGFQSVVHPTGRPALGLGLPRWNYGKLSFQVDQMFVQTQTYCKRGDFDKSISRLIQQFKRARSTSSVIPQVTVGFDNVNAVSAEGAAACVDIALRSGVRAITNWWETDNPSENTKFLALVRPH